MATVTYHVALAFKKSEDEGGGIVACDLREARSSEQAIRLADSLAKREGHCGAIAFSRTGDPALGDFEDAVILNNLDTSFPIFWYSSSLLNNWIYIEVADFVMHAVGGQARHNRKQRGTFRADFCAVFHSVHPDLTSYTEIEAVVRGEPSDTFGRRSRST